MDDSKKTVRRSATLFFSGTLFSRASGMFRDMALAYFFGSGRDIALFFVAFRFAALLRRVFGEGVISGGFVPYYTSIKGKDEGRADRLYRDLFFSIFFSLFLIIGFFEILLFFGKSFYGGDFLMMIIIMLPGVIFASLYSLNSSYLHIKGRYFIPSFAPFLFNISWIVGAYLLRGGDNFYFSFFVLFAFFLQFFITLPGNFFSLQRPKLFSKDVRGVIKPIALVILGVVAFQINTALDSLFAIKASVKGPAYLWYAARVNQLPFALFAIATSSALFPPLSRSFGRGDMDGYFGFIRFACKRSIVFMLFSTFFIFGVGRSSLNLLFGRGAFLEEAVFRSSTALFLYAVGLLPAALTLIVVAAMHAKKSYFLPFVATIFSLFLNVFLNYLFIFSFGWGAESVALSTSIASIFNFFFIYFKGGFKFFDRKLGIFFLKSLASSLLALSVSLYIGKFLKNLFFVEKGALLPREFISQFGTFSLLAIAFFTIFFISNLLLKREEFLEVIKP